MTVVSDLLIVGASTRAAACSAMRAGKRPWCIDLFADEDLNACATVVKVSELNPTEISHALKEFGFPTTPEILLTGGMENALPAVEFLETQGKLLGCGAAIIQAVRNPLSIANVLNANGFPCLNLMHDHQVPDEQHQWVWKSFQSAAGLHVKRWRKTDTISNPGQGYFQEYRTGDSISAVYFGKPNGCDLLGCTRQLLKRNQWGDPFLYAGNIGPLILTPEVQNQIHRIGSTIANAFSLRHLFGMDFILTDENVWLCEINPRYPASVEVLELALQTSLLDGGMNSDQMLAHPQQFVGKQIVYAEREFLFPDCTEFLRVDHSFALPKIADVPQPQSRIGKGEPVCTLFASGTTLSKCEKELRKQVQSWNSKWYAEW